MNLNVGGTVTTGFNYSSLAIEKMLHDFVNYKCVCCNWLRLAGHAHVKILTRYLFSVQIKIGKVNPWLVIKVINEFVKYNQMCAQRSLSGRQNICRRKQLVVAQR